MTCEHGFIGPCAVCDGAGQIPSADFVSPYLRGPLRRLEDVLGKASDHQPPKTIMESTPGGDEMARRQIEDLAKDGGGDG